MAVRLLWFLTLFTCYESNAQFFSKEKKLLRDVAIATSDSQKVAALGELANFYYIYRAEAKADSVLQKQFLIAELSDNKNLILQSLFGKALTNVNNWASTKAYDKALAFLQKGLRYARETGKSEYERVAYIRIASIYRKMGQYDNALAQATLALTSSTADSDDDSLKSAVFLELGDIFLAKGDAVPAYKNYNNAFDVAYALKDHRQQSECYHHFATLYQSLGNKELAKANLLKSLQLNKQHGDETGLLHDYIDLSRITDEEEYLKKYTALAARIGRDEDILYGKSLRFAYLMVVQKNSEAALAYLNANEDLKQSYLNTGIFNYYWNIGNVYRYAGEMDSAIHYFLLALPEFERSYDLNKQKSVLKALGESYFALSQPEKSINYFEKALSISEQQNDFATSATIYESLSKLYEKTGDYKKAFFATNQNMYLKDTLQQLNAQRDVVMLEVDRENKKHEKDLQNAEAERLRTMNLQYMGITIAIAAVFTFMLLLGMFPMSNFTIKLLSFFAFICLFEFIVLLVDNYVHKVTHGEPLKVWLIKIVLIAALVPVQHFLEHMVVRFLASQRLLRMRQQMSMKKLWTNMKTKIKRPALSEAGIEEDTAVL